MDYRTAAAGVGRLARHVDFCLRDPAGLGQDYAFRERFNLALFIAPDRRFLFTKNEKCGNNTCRMTLQRVALGRPLPDGFRDSNRWFAPLLQPSDLDLTDARALNPMVPLKFAVVRDPYSRILSCYLNKFGHPGKKRAAFARRAGGPEDMSFGAFVDRVSRQAPREMDPHWRVQVHNLHCDLIAYDRLIPFERLEEDLAEVLAGLGEAVELKSVRKGASRDYRERLARHYTPQIARTVRDTFAEDFERFGYPTEFPL
jgi:hypothetical protein